MKFIKRYNFLPSCLVLFLVSSMSFANTAQMNSTLVRIGKILNQINPLINLAERQQDPNARVQFQFETLRHDVADIQMGIAHAIHRVSIQPRMLKPLSGDYLPAAKLVLKKESSIKSGDST